MPREVLGRRWNVLERALATARRRRPRVVALVPLVVLAAGAATAGVTAGSSDGPDAAVGSGAQRGSPASNVEWVKLAFDCAPPRPGPPRSIGDTVCVGTETWRRRIAVLQRIRVDASAGSPEWSPDGERLLFRIGSSRGTSQRDDVAMIGLDGSSYVDLTNSPARGDRGATWSPDGRRIAFGSRSRVFVMNADGSALRRVTRLRGGHPQWTPDGRLIAFSSNRCACGGPDGSRAYHVYSGRRDDSTRLLGADVRPDGARKAVAVLSLTHRWMSSHRLRLAGYLHVGGTPAPGRTVVVGRLGERLPTERLRSVRTRADGFFSVTVRVPTSRDWRFGTAYFDGSAREWSTTAFTPLTPAVP